MDGTAERFGETHDGGIHGRIDGIGQSSGHDECSCHASVEMNSEGPFLQAQVLHAALAVAAEATVEMRLDGDQVPFPDIPHPDSDSIDETCHLMSRHDSSNRRECTFHDLRVRAADADSLGSDPHLSGAGFQDGDLLQAQIVRSMETHTRHGVARSSPGHRYKIAYEHAVSYIIRC